MSFIGACTADKCVAMNHNAFADAQQGIASPGGASEYESWTYNAAGQRASQSAIDPAANAFAATSYGYTAGTGEMTSANTTGAVTSDSTDPAGTRPEPPRCWRISPTGRCARSSSRSCAWRRLTWLRFPAACCARTAAACTGGTTACATPRARS
jgi:hypothetical protein